MPSLGTGGWRPLPIYLLAPSSQSAYAMPPVALQARPPAIDGVVLSGDVYEPASLARRSMQPLSS